MIVEKFLSQPNTGTRLEKILNSLKSGEGLTKDELSKLFNLQSGRVIERWFTRYPVLLKHRVYIPTGKSRMAIFVNLKYKEILLKNGKATENY